MPLQATFYVGHNVKGTPTWRHEQIVAYAGLAFPDGFTAHQAKGGWQGGHEETTVLTVLGIPLGAIRPAKDTLAETFKQEEVLALVQEVHLF